MRLAWALREFSATAVSLVATRLALLRVEAEEEAWRLWGLLVWGLTAVLAGLFGLFFFAVFLTVLLWEGQRLVALAVFTALFLALAAVSFLQARRRIRQGSRLFVGSLAELERDAAALKPPSSPTESSR